MKERDYKMGVYKGKDEFCPDCKSSSPSSCDTCMVQKDESEQDMRTRLRKKTGKDNNVNPHIQE